MVKCPGLPGLSRVGLVVSKGTGGAVARNRIKRRLRHSLRAVELKPGMDYVIIAQREVADAPQPLLMGWLERSVEDGDV